MLSTFFDGMEVWNKVTVDGRRSDLATIAKSSRFAEVNCSCGAMRGYRADVAANSGARCQFKQAGKLKSHSSRQGRLSPGEIR